MLPFLKEYESRRGAHFESGLPLHYGSPESEYFALRGSAGWIDLSHWTKVRVSGGERWEWLQGQISQDVALLRERGSGQACLLKPTGQIIADLFLGVFGESVFLIAGETPPPLVVERLARMVVLEDVTLEDVTPSMGLIALQGPSIGKSLPLRGSHFPMWEQDVSGSGGFLVLVSAEDAEFFPSLLADLTPVGLLAWDIARLELGLPLYGRDFDEGTLVMEMGDTFLAPRVSLEKGCYTGQEVVARVMSRGHTHRTWVGLRCEAPVEAGAGITDGSGKEIGRVTSSAVSPQMGPIASAYLKKEFCLAGTRVEVGEVGAQVFPFPLFMQETP